MVKKAACLNILGNDGSMAKLDANTGVPVVLIGGSDWEIWHESDLTANDNDKTITVPAGYEWQVLFVYIEWTSDGNAGARQLQVDIRDAGSNIIGQIRVGVTQAASLVYSYMLAPSLADLISARDTTYVMTPFPPTVFLSSGYSIRVYDNNNVSGSDDFDLHVHLARREL